MNIRRVPVLFALLAVALPCAALAVPAAPVAQVAAPVRLDSCSALALDATSTPVYGVSIANTAMDSSGHVTGTGPMPVDQHIPMAPMYSGTRVFGTAQSVNGSGKTVTGVVYQFNVLGRNDERIATFYGARTGTFTQNERITPYGIGSSSPWSTQLTRPDIESVSCFVAFVRFGDGTTWRSPLATIPPALRSAP